MRVLVSDFKGGLSSRNIVFKVGDYHKASTSSISGIVYSQMAEYRCSCGSNAKPECRAPSGCFGK